MKMTEVLNKTIKDIAPFDKNHNRNLKDAFISESYIKILYKMSLRQHMHRAY